MPSFPPGRYERLVDRRLREALKQLESEPEITKVDAAEAPEVVARFLARRIQDALEGLGSKQVEEQWRLANEVLEFLIERVGEGRLDSGDLLDEAREELRAVPRPASGLGTAASAVPPAPSIPLSNSELLVNAREERGVGAVLGGELLSADRVDLLCSFLKWSGFRILRKSLEELRGRGAPLRVLTTAYCGVTEARVLDALADLGAEVRVSLDTRRTRLHAKAWLLHRESGFSTAFIGSSNLSAAALLDGLEWNVRISGVENPAILERFRGTFDSYWEDREFQSWGSELVHQRFYQVARRERGGEEESRPQPLLGLDLRPYPFQEEILERLAAARKVHDRHRNLIVAATGTGKTVVAAFDFARLCSQGQAQEPGAARPSLLFVAHRKEILEQSRRLFREILKDPAFGERMVDGERPREGRHVFAAIQSLARVPLDSLPADAFDVVLVDEFHHAEAPTYRRLLNHLAPKELLGLTATPERTDGRWVQDTFFDGRITAELRLWDALERGFLCPFQYFGIADGTDLRGLAWKRSGYDPRALNDLYTGNDVRALLVHRQVQEKVSDPERMRALGFCVSVEHARFMARRFVEFGYRAAAVWGETPRDERSRAIGKLRSGELQILFAVDLFNEGLDVPAIDTLLLLRPTGSAILFQQQLGRGLRLAEGKECLTVLDFIGQANRRYSWAAIFRAVLGGSARRVESLVAEGFPTLPPGCAMRLDRQAQELVLENIRQSTRDTWGWLAEELRKKGSGTRLTDFLEQEEVELEDVYEKDGWTWSALRARAGFGSARPADPQWKAVPRLRHVDDPHLLRAWRRILAAPSGLMEEEALRRPAAMLAATLLRALDAEAPQKLRDCLVDRPALVSELDALFEAQLDRVAHLPIPLAQRPELPLHVHCRYSLDQVLAAFGIHHRIQAGVHFHQETGTDLFFVTLQKSEKDYSPRTMYRDFAISPELFHWESQNTTSPESPTGRRYQKPRPPHQPALLFLRRSRRGRGGVTEPYLLAGPVHYSSHQGSRPMQITWRLQHPLPGDWFRQARLAAV